MTLMSPFKSSSSIYPAVSMQTPTYHPSGRVLSTNAPSSTSHGMSPMSNVVGVSGSGPTTASMGGPMQAAFTRPGGTIMQVNPSGPTTGSGGPTTGGSNGTLSKRQQTNERINAAMGYGPVLLHDPTLEHQVRASYRNAGNILQVNPTGPTTGSGGGYATPPHIIASGPNGGTIMQVTPPVNTVSHASNPWHSNPVMQVHPAVAAIQNQQWQNSNSHLLSIA